MMDDSIDLNDFMKILERDQCFKFANLKGSKDQHMVILEICIALAPMNLIVDMMMEILQYLNLSKISDYKKCQIATSVYFRYNDFTLKK